MKNIIREIMNEFINNRDKKAFKENINDIKKEYQTDIKEVEHVLNAVNFDELENRVLEILGEW